MSFIGQLHFVAIATLWAWLLPFEGPLFLPAQKKGAVVVWDEGAYGVHRRFLQD